LLAALVYVKLIHSDRQKDAE